MLMSMWLVDVSYKYTVGFFYFFYFFFWGGGPGDHDFVLFDDIKICITGKNSWLCFKSMGSNISDEHWLN